MELEALERRIRRLEDLEEIKQLKARYAAYCDANYDADALAELFTTRCRPKGDRHASRPSPTARHQKISLNTYTMTPVAGSLSMYT